MLEFHVKASVLTSGKQSDYDILKSCGFIDSSVLERGEDGPVWTFPLHPTLFYKATGVGVVKMDESGIVDRVLFTGTISGKAKYRNLAPGNDSAHAHLKLVNIRGIADDEKVYEYEIEIASSDLSSLIDILSTLEQAIQ